MFFVELLDVVDIILLGVLLVPLLSFAVVIIVMAYFSILFNLIDLIVHLVRGRRYETPRIVVCLGLQQVPRPPGADDLYKGIYEDFVKEGKKGGGD